MMGTTKKILKKDRMFGSVKILFWYLFSVFFCMFIVIQSNEILI